MLGRDVFPAQHSVFSAVEYQRLDRVRPNGHVNHAADDDPMITPIRTVVHGTSEARQPIRRSSAPTLPSCGTVPCHLSLPDFAKRFETSDCRSDRTITANASTKPRS